MAVHDVLPPEFTFVSSAPSQGTCAAPAAGAIDCEVGEIAAGAEAQIVITMNVPGGFPAGGAATNKERVTSTTTDPDSTDDTAEFTTTGDTAADVASPRPRAPTPVVAGEAVTWTITVFNDGPSPAAGVSVTDDLPAGLGTVTAPGCTVGRRP